MICSFVVIYKTLFGVGKMFCSFLSGCPTKMKILKIIRDDPAKRHPPGEIFSIGTLVWQPIKNDFAVCSITLGTR
jgi:hypothetical protein